MTEFRLLGPLELWTAGHQIDLGPSKQRALLASLLVDAGRTVPADTLISRMWDDNPPAAVRNVLYTHVSRIRRLLSSIADGGAAPVRLSHRPGGYLLHVEQGQVDLYRFRRLVTDARADPDAALAAAGFRRALNLWHGDACADLSGTWIDQVREQLGQERLSAQLDCLESELRLGQHSQVLPELEALVAAQPLSERLAGMLMLARYRNGEQAEGISCYHAVRRRLAEELGVDPGPGLQRLYAQLLRADPALAAPGFPARPAHAGRTAPPAPAARTPAQLPHDVAGFAGRDRELAALHAMLPTSAGSAVVIAILDGTAGVGKTALAVHFGHQIGALFPDGALHADLRGHSGDSPTRPLDALARFLRALGVAPPDVPVDLDEAAGAYRSLLAGRRMLVVLDNAGSAEQVRPLLPGAAGCLVLVTSRSRLDGLVARDGARRLTLDVLPADEARLLLARAIGEDRVRAEPAAVAELAQACAYLPLALRIAVANLASHPHLSIASHVAGLVAGNRLAALRVVDDEQTAVRAAFDVSYANLDPEARRLFRRLGLVPGGEASVEAAAAVADADPAEAARLLDRLACAHLVEQPALRRFAFHDLLRRYAWERAHAEDEPAQRTAAVNRLYGLYLCRVDAAARLVYPETVRLPVPVADTACEFGDHTDALEWLDAERANLVAAVAHAAEQGPRPMAWLLADALRGYFVRRMYTVDWLAVATDGLAAARVADDPAAQASAHLSLGNVDTFLGRHEEAIDHCAEARVCARRASWRIGEAAALGNRGNVHWQAGQLHQAGSQYRRALAISRRIGWRVGEANNLANLGLISRSLGRLAQAADYFTQALTLDRQTGSRYGEAITTGNLGEVYRVLGRLDEAHEHLSQALSLSRELGDRGTEADVLYALAAVHLDAGRRDDARDTAHAAIGLARETGDRRVEADALNVLALVERARSHLREAALLHESALDLARESGDRGPEAAALIGLSATRRQTGNAGGAMAAAEQALAIARDAGYGVLEGEALTALAHAYLDQHRRRDAVEHAGRALAAHRATGHRLGLARSLLVLGHALDADQADAAGAHRREAHGILDAMGLDRPAT